MSRQPHRALLLWRGAATVLLVCWWQVLAATVLSDRGWHPYWWFYLDDLAGAAQASWQEIAVLAAALAGALLIPWVLPASRLGSSRGWRGWAIVCAITIILAPQPWWIGATWLRAATLDPATPTSTGRPTRPFLWIIAESADVGLHLPRVDRRGHDYYSVRYTSSVPPGAAAGVWAQVCGAQLDSRWSPAPHRCLVDAHWRIVHGRPGSSSFDSFDELLASTGAQVVRRPAGAGGAAGEDDLVPDASLFSAALAPDKLRPHVLVLTSGTKPHGNTTASVAASDAAMDQAIDRWLDRNGRNGVVLVTGNRPRQRSGWNALPARLYGVAELALPREANVALTIGRSAPGRLMGGLRNGTLYDLGCTAWDLAGFVCDGVGHGVSLTRDSSKTLGMFRPSRP